MSWSKANSTAGDFTITVDPAVSYAAPDAVWRKSTDATRSLATIQRAVDFLPQGIKHAVGIEAAAGTYAAVELDNLRGNGSLRIVGTMSLASLTTGPNSGTCGTGTTTTSVINGGTTWTASNLVGKFIEITTAAGVVTTRPILANTTTAATIHAVTGCNNTCTFRILSHATIISDLSIIDTSADITIERCSIALLDTARNSKLTFTECTFTDDITLDDDSSLTFDSCSTSSGILLTRFRTARILNTLVNDGYVSLQTFMDVTTEIYALSCSASALSLGYGLSASIGYYAKSCTATPLVITSVLHSAPYGTGVAGASNTGAYGVSISGNSYVDIIGYLTLTGGTSDIHINGLDLPYATIQAAGGNATNIGASIAVAAGTGVYNGGYATQQSDAIVGGSELLYGFRRLVGESINAAGTGIGNAATLGANYTYINGGTGGVKPRYASSGISAVQIFSGVNRSGSALTLYPYNGSCTINGGAAGAGVALANGAWFEMRAVTATDYDVKVW